MSLQLLPWVIVLTSILLTSMVVSSIFVILIFNKIRLLILEAEEANRKIDTLMDKESNKYSIKYETPIDFSDSIEDLYEIIDEMRKSNNKNIKTIKSKFEKVNKDIMKIKERG